MAGASQSGYRHDALAWVLMATLLASACATTGQEAVGQARLDPAGQGWVSDDGARFPFKVWGDTPRARGPVVVALHGLSGASEDFAKLGEASAARGMTLYAYALRGQGRDPEPARVGDISQGERWIRDLAEFDALVRTRHPERPVVWLGESLGALVITRTAAEQRGKAGAGRPDRLVLVSPVLSLEEKMLVVQRRVLDLGAMLAPRVKVPLASLAGEEAEAWEVTEDSHHLEQLEKTPWAVNAFTLRFYREVLQLVEAMKQWPPRIPEPVLVLHAGRDPLTDHETVKAFAEAFPKGELKAFPESRHLLFYCDDREKVVRTIVDWVEKG